MLKFFEGNLKKSALVLAGFLLMFTGFSRPAHSGPVVDESGKNWNFKLSALFAYDDNVVNAPTDILLASVLLTGKSDHMFGWSATGTIKHPFTKKFSVRADYDIDMTIHSKLNVYDLTSQIFSANTIYKFTPLMNIMMDYKFIYNIVDGDDFSGIQYVGPSFHYMHPKYGLTRIFYTYKYTNNWQNDLRDNDQHSVGFKQYLFFSKFTRRIGLGYKFTTDDTMSDSFDRNLHTLDFKGKMPMFYGIDMNISFEFIFRNYITRLGSGSSLRNDTQHKYFLVFSKVLLKKMGILENLTGKVSYRYIFNDSNLLLREYRSNRFTVELRARF